MGPEDEGSPSDVPVPASTILSHVRDPRRMQDEV